MVYIIGLRNSCERPGLSKEQGTYLLTGDHSDTNRGEERQSMHK